MQGSIRVVLGRSVFAWLSVLAIACGGGSDKAASTTETTATGKVENAARSAVEEASSAVQFGSALTIRHATANSDKVSCTSSTCTFTAYPVLSDKATIDGTVDSTYNIGLKISFSSYSGISGTVNVSGKVEETLHVTFDVTVDGSAYASDYQLGSDGTRVGKVNGHKFKDDSSTGADASVAVKDAASSGSSVFANCGSSSANSCQVAACSYKQYYENCTQQSGMSSSVCTHMLDCTETYISCICTNGTLDQAKIQGCVSTYLSCAQIQQ